MTDHLSRSHDDDLRLLVNGAVDDVEPADRLSEIRLRTQRPRYNSNRPPWRNSGPPLHHASTIPMRKP